MTLPHRRAPARKPAVLAAEARQVRPGDEVVYTDGGEHFAIRPALVEADPADDTVTLVPRGREEHLLHRAHPVIIIRGTPGS